jgi:hypothetical protein
MQRRIRPSVACCGVAVLGLVVIAGCGDSSGPTFLDFPDSPDEPRISQLDLRPLNPERANRTVRYVASVHFSDAQDDVTDGTCQVDTSVGASTVPVEITVEQKVFVGGTATCRFSVLARAPGDVSGQLRLVDVEGHPSNALAFVLGIR